MKKAQRNIVIAGLVVAGLAGTGAAIAANQTSPKEEQKAVIDDAAKQLGVAPDKLTVRPPAGARQPGRAGRQGRPPDA